MAILQKAYKVILTYDKLLKLNDKNMLILVHNHPSGDPSPSKADIEMTMEVKEAGEKLGIVLHDHVIVSKSGNNSFKTMGLL